MCKKQIFIYFNIVIGLVIIGCNVKINTKRMLEVYDSSGDFIDHETGEYDFGSSIAGFSLYETFVIYNIGNTFLELTGDPTVTITGADASNFIVLEQPETYLESGQSSTFKIRFVPTQNKVHEAFVKIANNDKDFTPYTFKVIGTGAAPEINVRQGNTNIPSGNGVYDFGEILYGSSSGEVQFTIENLGIMDLELSGNPKIEISGANISSFFIKQSSVAQTIKRYNPSTFSINMQPDSFGHVSAEVSIANNDTNENPYEFTIKGFCRRSKAQFDFNGDGYDDVIIGTANMDGFFIQLGSPTQTTKIEASEISIKFIDDEDTEIGGDMAYSAGDFNNDGYDDIIVGPCIVASYRKKGALIFFGRANPPKVIKSIDADVKIIEDYTVNRFALQVCGVGDLNNDGFSDIAVTGENDDETGSMLDCVWVFFGGKNPKSEQYVSDADVKIYGEHCRGFASDVSYAGDFNNDGFDDLIIGAVAYKKVSNYIGAAFIFYGRTSFPKKMRAPIANVIMVGNQEQDDFGYRVSNAGDIDNDGYDDVVISATENDIGGEISGCAYVFYGNSNPTRFINASNADVTIVGDSTYIRFGSSISGAGDVNGDGYDDIIVGASQVSANGTDSGRIYIFLSSENLPTIINASNADTIIDGEHSDISLGSCVSNLGDLNVDGFDDVVFNAPTEYEDGFGRGRAYILLGKSNMNSRIENTDSDVTFFSKTEEGRFASTVAGGK